MLKFSFKIIIILFIVFTSNAFSAEKILWEKGPNQNISVRSINKSDIDHPVSISNQQLKNLLTLLHIHSKSSEITKPVFNEEQVSLLAKYVSKGLLNLTNNEAIYFSIIKENSSMGGLIKSEVFTAGTIYNTQRGLTITIGDHERDRDYSYEAIFDPSKKGKVRYEFDYGLADTKNKILLTLNTDLVNDDTFVATSNKLLVPSNKLDSLSISQTKYDHSIQKANSTDTVSRDEVKEMIAEQPSLSKEEIREIVIETKATNEFNATSSNSTPTINKSLEERFEILESLKVKGLITEQEYQQKRKELLSEL